MEKKEILSGFRAHTLLKSKDSLFHPLTEKKEGEEKKPKQNK